MGNLTSIINSEKNDCDSEILKKYSIKKRAIDPRYQEIIILEDKDTKEEVVMKEVLFGFYDQYEKVLKQYQLRQNYHFFNINLPRKSIIHKNILKVLDIYTHQSIQLCSKFFKLEILLEYTNQTLETEILSRKNIYGSQNQAEQQFTEEELWDIIHQLVKGLAYLQEHKLFHGNVKPSNIFQFNQNVKTLIFQITFQKKYKVAENGLINQNLEYVATLASSQNPNFSDVYLSPKLLKAIKEKEVNPKHNAAKSDVFSLGMTLLHAATLEPAFELYDYQYCEINSEQLAIQLAYARELYSDILIGFIKQMLVFDESRRPDFIDLRGQLTDNFSKLLCSFENTQLINTQFIDKTTQFQMHELTKIQEVSPQKEEPIIQVNNKFFSKPVVEDGDDLDLINLQKLLNSNKKMSPNYSNNIHSILKHYDTEKNHSAKKKNKDNSSPKQKQKTVRIQSEQPNPNYQQIIPKQPKKQQLQQEPYHQVLQYESQFKQFAHPFQVSPKKLSQQQQYLNSEFKENLNETKTDNNQSYNLKLKIFNSNYFNQTQDITEQQQQKIYVDKLVNNQSQFQSVIAESQRNESKLYEEYIQKMKQNDSIRSQNNYSSINTKTQNQSQFQKNSAQEPSQLVIKQNNPQQQINEQKNFTKNTQNYSSQYQRDISKQNITNTSQAQEFKKKEKQQNYNQVSQSQISINNQNNTTYYAQNYTINQSNQKRIDKSSLAMMQQSYFTEVSLDYANPTDIINQSSLKQNGPYYPQPY